MAKKKFENITLIRKRTKILFSGDPWLVDVTYFTNGKESYSCQIIRPDLASRIKRLCAEGFKIMNDN